MKQNNPKTQFVLCVRNEGYPASLELRKIYHVLSDNNAADYHWSESSTNQVKITCTRETLLFQ